MRTLLICLLGLFLVFAVCDAACPTICPAIYLPICADVGGKQQTFGSECEMRSYNCNEAVQATQLYQGECQ
ncbi:vasotab-like [Sergentomyia squamirostris]